ncbi:MAG: hypothetical protein MIO88_01215 [Methanoregulaceae archaeon]|nr:hypothetical protein [Methanoregulaceae archaeon]
METRKKAIATFGLICALPVVFMVPAIAEYPLTLAGAIVAAAVFINTPDEHEGEGYHADITVIRDRAKVVSCPM